MTKLVKLIPLLLALALLAGVPAAVSGQEETTISFSSTSYTVDEEAGTVQVSMTISTSVSYEVSVDLSTTSRTAVAGQDYTAASTTVTFPANIISTRAVTITIIDDPFPEYDEYFTVSLESDDERVAIGGGPATVTIESDDTLELAFDQETYTVRETSGTLRVVIRVVSPVIACPFNGSFSVGVSTSDGTAIHPYDYQTHVTRVEFRRCTVAVARSIFINDDGWIEATENFLLRMERTQSTPNFLTFSRAEATVEILDDADRATVRIERQSYRVDESASTVEISMRLNNPDRSTACVSAVPISLGLSTLGGTAEPSLDYEPVDTTVTFEPCARVRAIGIPIIDDARVEWFLETFTVHLVRTESTDRRIRIDSSRAVVEIQDNDTVLLGFDSAEYTVNEGESFDLGVNLSGDATCPVDFDFDVLLGSAIPQGARSSIAKPASRVAFKRCDLRRDLPIDTGDIEATAELRFALERSSRLNAPVIIGQQTATAYIVDTGGATEAFADLATDSGDSPWGIWSNEETVWVSIEGAPKIYAYDMDSKARDSDNGFDSLDGDNDDPTGIWSNGTTMWVADYVGGKIYAYQMNDKARDSGRDFDTLSIAGNDNPTGIWSNGATMWVADDVDDKIYAYDMATMAEESTQEFDSLDSENSDPVGIWSDETTMWVADQSDDKIYAYEMSTKARVEEKEFNALPSTGNDEPRGIWSDDTIMWVVDDVDDAIYAYYFPGEHTAPVTVRPSRTVTGGSSEFDETDAARPSAVSPELCISAVVDPDGGEIELGDTITDRWASGCPSVTRGGRLAKYYTFNLPITAAVEIALDSHLDTYLVLRRGSLSGDIIASDDDSGPSNNSLIADTVTAGKYTIEATTFYADGVEADFTLSVKAVPRILYDGPVADVAHTDYAPEGPTMTVKLRPTLPMGTLEITVEDPDGFGEGAGPLGGAQVADGSAGTVLLALPKSAWVEYADIAVQVRQSGAWSAHTQADEQAMLTGRSAGLNLGPALLGLLQLIGSAEDALPLIESLAGVTSSPTGGSTAEPDKSALDAIFRESYANCVSQVTVPWLVQAPETTGVRISVPVMLDDNDYLSLAASFLASGDQPALAQLHDLLAGGEETPACQAPDAATK